MIVILNEWCLLFVVDRAFVEWDRWTLLLPCLFASAGAAVPWFRFELGVSMSSR